MGAMFRLGLLLSDEDPAAARRWWQRATEASPRGVGAVGDAGRGAATAARDAANTRDSENDHR